MAAPKAAAHLSYDLRTHFRDPHVLPELRNMTSRDIAVRETVRRTPGVLDLIYAATAAVRAYRAGPGSGPITIAVGCVDGRHRAPTVCDLLATALTEEVGLQVHLLHRDIDKPVIQRAARKD